MIGKDEAEDYKGAGSGTAFLVKNGDRFFLFAETGDLIIAKLSPKGYEEISRAKILEPTARPWPQGRLEPPGLRQQVRLRPQRQGDRLRESGEGVRGEVGWRAPAMSGASRRSAGLLMLTLLGSPRRCCDGLTRRETLAAGA